MNNLFRLSRDQDQKPSNCFYIILIIFIVFIYISWVWWLSVCIRIGFTVHVKDVKCTVVFLGGSAINLKLKLQYWSFPVDLMQVTGRCYLVFLLGSFILFFIIDIVLNILTSITKCFQSLYSQSITCKVYDQHSVMQH